MRARSSAQRVQGVRWVRNLRARSSAPSVQGVRWVINLRARSSAYYMQGVRLHEIDSQNENKPKIHNRDAANNYLYTTPRNPARTSPHPDNIPIAVIPESAHLARPIAASTNAASGICMLSPTLAMVGEVNSTARAHR